MAVSVYAWSTTAGTNATADANINWSEGQLPSSVNDSARAMMAALASMIRDQGGYAATGGSSNAYTLALSQTMSAAVPALVGFRADRNNTGAATLNVDSLGAYPLRAVTGTALAADDIVAGCNYVVTWNSSSSEWLLINPRSVNLPASSKLGTPASGTLTNCTGLPVSTGISGLGTGVATFLATPSSANLASAVTDETGTGALVFANSPTLVTPALGTPASGVLTNCTGLPTAGHVDGSITTIKIADANVTAAKLDGAQSGSAPIYGVRAWVHFTVSGGVVTVRASGNIASVVRNSVGNFTITFTTAMADQYYASVCNVKDTGYYWWSPVASQTASAVTFVFNYGTSPSFTDPQGVSVMVMR